MHAHSEGARLRLFFWRKKRERVPRIPSAFDASIAACPELHVRRRGDTLARVLLPTPTNATVCRAGTPQAEAFEAFDANPFDLPLLRRQRHGAARVRCQRLRCADAIGLAQRPAPRLLLRNPVALAWPFARAPPFSLSLTPPKRSRDELGVEAWSATGRAVGARIRRQAWSAAGRAIGVGRQPSGLISGRSTCRVWCKN